MVPGRFLICFASAMYHTVALPYKHQPGNTTSRIISNFFIKGFTESDDTSGENLMIASTFCG